jgi:hypothetical protein
VSDRIEALVVLAVVVSACFAVPAAAQAGTLVLDAGVRTAQEQAQTRHSVEAVALEDSASLLADVDSPAYVRAQWREGTRLRTEHVVSPVAVGTGQPLTIWLDDADNVVAAPLTADDADLSAVLAGATAWVTIVACSALVAFGARRALDRSRGRAWERELNLLAHYDDGWSNRPAQ